MSTLKDDYPYDFENETTADGEQVQEQFDFISEWLEDRGISTDPLPYSALDLTNSIDAGDIKDNEVGVAEIATQPQYFGVANSDVTSLAGSPGSPVNVCQVTLPDVGTYLVNATLVYKKTTASSGLVGMRSRIYAGLTQIGPQSETKYNNAQPSDHTITHEHFRVINVVATNTIVTLQGDSYQGGTFLSADSIVYATRIS